MTLTQRELELLQQAIASLLAHLPKVTDANFGKMDEILLLADRIEQEKIAKPYREAVPVDDLNCQGPLDRRVEV